MIAFTEPFCLSATGSTRATSYTWGNKILTRDGTDRQNKRGPSYLGKGQRGPGLAWVGAFRRVGQRFCQGLCVG